MHHHEMDGTLQVMVFTGCDFFPKSTDMPNLLGSGVSAAELAKQSSHFENRIDDFQEVGTTWDTMDLEGSEDEHLYGDES